MITAIVIQVVATEDPADLKPLLTAVGATPEQPAYVFVTLESDGKLRDYIVKWIPISDVERRVIHNVEP